LVILFILIKGVFPIVSRMLFNHIVQFLGKGNKRDAISTKSRKTIGHHSLNID
jgi:hypothetical protein